MAGRPRAVYCMDDDSGNRIRNEAVRVGKINKSVRKIRIGNTEGKFHFNFDIYQNKTNRIYNYSISFIRKIYGFKTMVPVA